MIRHSCGLGIDPLDRIVFPHGQTHFAMPIIMPQA
jgi:hypothetical protein